MAGPPCSLVSSIPCTPSLMDKTASVPAAIAIKELRDGMMYDSLFFGPSSKHNATKGLMASKIMAMMTSAALALVWAAILASLAVRLSGLILFSVAFQEDKISLMRCPWPPRRLVSESSRVPRRFLVGGNARRQFVSPVASKTSQTPMYQTLGY